MNRQEIYDALQGIELNPNKRAQLANLFFNMSSKDTNDNSIMYYLCINSSKVIENHLGLGISLQGKGEYYYSYFKLSAPNNNSLDSLGVNNLTLSTFDCTDSKSIFDEFIKTDLLAVHFYNDVDPAVPNNANYVIFPYIKVDKNKNGDYIKFFPVNGVVNNKLIHGVYLDPDYKIAVINSIYNSNNK